MTPWRGERLNPPNPLQGSNGVAFGPDGRLYAAQFLAGRISAVDPATGYIADLVPGRVWRRSPRGSTAWSPRCSWARTAASTTRT
ncbi:hypothetical protein GCM10010383_50540 [Streptomyces lomondensis]|uniref:SMP-30/Gluconolactonase/LRE-like region domain-containing protein n=1 Tax=Streptomyces lomondensis TaxID=68229 RepID=A0ABQ2XFF3_9ACTN|nr:hypothetical protein GCM10010383_50540 [Streptomyces lomondensis]